MAEPKINENLVQIMGGRKCVIHIDGPLRMDQDYRLYIDGSVAEIVEVSNNDGTVDRIHKFRGTYAEESK